MRSGWFLTTAAGQYSLAGLGMLSLLGPLLTSHPISQANPCRLCDMQSLVKTSSPNEVHINKLRIKIEVRTSPLAIWFNFTPENLYIYVLSAIVELSM